MNQYKYILNPENNSLIDINTNLAKKILYIANVGDTRAVLLNDKQFLRISYDHKGSDSKE